MENVVSPEGAPSPKNASLSKPDMRAVLSRTHIHRSVHGFLLPVLEAISNSIHGTEDAALAGGKGNVEIVFKNLHSPKHLSISITDDGVGLNNENFRSFLTPFSGFKLSKKGRGFGRFIAFKVFSDISYNSTYLDRQRELHTRAFTFDISRDEEIEYTNQESPLEKVGTEVVLREPLDTWHEIISALDESDVADTIASHFLPQFLYGKLPDIRLRFDDKKSENLTERFAKTFVETEKGTFHLDIDGVDAEFHYSFAKIERTRSFKSHSLLFSAADRIVGSPRDLTNILGQSHFTDDNGNYIIISVVSSDLFEERLNDARTVINLPIKDFDLIVKKIGEIIQQSEASQIDKIKDRQSQDLNLALRESPILRIGLRGKSVPEYVRGKPNNWTAQQFVSDLAIERWRMAKDLSEAISLAAASEQSYAENIKNLASKIDVENKEALAEYVVHRRRVIELIEAARKYQGDTSTHAPEDRIHDLIFQRFSDTVKTGYFEHNLWVIDDALAFLPLVTSDRTAKGASRKKGDKVPDLAFFDDSLILGDTEGTTISVVEFKRPSRNDYAFGPSKSDPVRQVLETLDLAVAAGGVTTTDGSHMSFKGAIRRFGYIVADITSTLHNVLQLHDFQNDQNPKIYFRYRDREKVLIQVVGYDTLVENAKKRNQAFFSVLLGE